MLFFILYIIAMIALVLFVEGAEYLVCVMFWMMLCWVPGNGDTVATRNRGMGIANKYKYCREHNNSNPLYVRGYLRTKKKTSLFGSLKGLYVCQIISLVMLILSGIYLCVKFIYGEKILVEVMLIVCSIILIIGWTVLKMYYLKCCDWSYRYTENAEGIWMPFRFLYQVNTGFLNKNSLSCHYYVTYEEMKKRLELKASEKGYVFSKCYKTDYVKEFNFFTRLNGETLDILALIHTKQMQEGCWDIFNNIFGIFWKETIADRYEKRRMAFTFLICVDEYSRELRKTKVQMENIVDSKMGRYRLSALLDYSDHALLEIAADCRENGGDKRSRQIRKELLDMLGISWKFDGKEYPEGSEEPES